MGEPLRDEGMMGNGGRLHFFDVRNS